MKYVLYLLHSHNFQDIFVSYFLKKHPNQLQVRSLKLDSWEEDTMRIMERLGNDAVNKVRYSPVVLQASVT